MMFWACQNTTFYLQWLNLNLLLTFVNYNPIHDPRGAAYLKDFDMTLEIFLNILIIALLIIGIVYAVLLEYRLSTAKENSRELSLLIDHFYKASQKIAEELAHLKELEEQAGAELKINLECARKIQADLLETMGQAEQKVRKAKELSTLDAALNRIENEAEPTHPLKEGEWHEKIHAFFADFDFDRHPLYRCARYGFVGFAARYLKI